MIHPFLFPSALKIWRAFLSCNLKNVYIQWHLPRCPSRFFKYFKMDSHSFTPFPLSSKRQRQYTPDFNFRSTRYSQLSDPQTREELSDVSIPKPSYSPTKTEHENADTTSSSQQPKRAHRKRLSINLLKPLPPLSAMWQHNKSQETILPSSYHVPDARHLSCNNVYAEYQFSGTPTTLLPSSPEKEKTKGRVLSYHVSNGVFGSKIRRDDTHPFPYQESQQPNYPYKNVHLDNSSTVHLIDEENIGNKEPLDWDSPTDPGNPKNWSPLKKWFVTLLTGYLCLVVSFGCSLYVTANIKFIFFFGVTQEHFLLGVTLYLIGLSLAPIIGAPLSEVVGRKAIYLTMLPLSMLFMVISAQTHKMNIILACRFFTGLFGAPVLAIAAGTIADLWDLDMLVTAMTVFSITPLAGPILGPIIGGYAMQNFKTSWNLIFYIQLLFAGAALPFLVIMPETYKPIILKRREKKREKERKRLAERHREDDGFDETLHSVENQNVAPHDQCEKCRFVSKFIGSAKNSLKVTLFFPIKLLLLEPIILISSIYTSFVFSILFAFLESYSYIFAGQYKFTLGQTGLSFLGIALGMLLASAFFVLGDRLYLQKILNKQKEEKLAAAQAAPKSKNEKVSPCAPLSTPGLSEFEIPIPPEDVLIICKIGAILLPISLFWQGWTAHYKAHWIVPLAAGVPFGISLLFIFFSLVVYIEFTYDNDAQMLASVFAANNIFRYLVAAGFPLFTVRMYSKLGIAWSATVFGSVAVVLIPVPWLFQYFGPWLRSKSKYAKQASPSVVESQESPNSPLVPATASPVASVAELTLHSENSKESVLMRDLSGSDSDSVIIYTSPACEPRFHSRSDNPNTHSFIAVGSDPYMAPQAQLTPPYYGSQRVWTSGDVTEEYMGHTYAETLHNFF